MFKVYSTRVSKVTLISGESIIKRRLFTSSQSIIKIRLFSSSRSFKNKINNNIKFDPFFITGIIDAEGSFVCIVSKNTGHRLRWRVVVVFQIGLHKKDLELLKSIKAYFGNVGIITENNKENMCAFRITSPQQILDYVLPHFDNYPLITQKLTDYNLFKNIVELMLKKSI